MAILPSPDLLLPFATGHDVVDPNAPMWARWSFDPQFLVPLGFAVWFYVRGLRRWTTRSREHPWWQTAFFFLGVVLLILALESPIDSLSEDYFAFHMLQHEILMMLAVPALLLGAPTTPSLRGMPRWLRLGVIRRLARRRSVRAAYRTVTHPAVAIFAMTATLWLWHLAPGWYDAALTHPVLHDIEHLSMAGVAWLFWWNVIDPKPLRSRLSYIPRVLYIFAGNVPQQFLGAMLTLASHPLYHAYAREIGPIALTPLDDQQLGGLIMWVPGGMMYLAAMGVTFAVWAHKSEQAQRAQEAAEDRRRAEARSAVEA